jgi:cell division protein FtsQ
VTRAPDRAPDRAPSRARDPGPAPLRYRLARLWRRRSLRRLVTVQLPALAMAAGLAHLAADPATHAWVAARRDAATQLIAQQGRFSIARIRIDGASERLTAQIRAALADVEGASSLGFDAAALRRRVEELGRVASARVALEAPDGLTVTVVERTPAAIWRLGETLTLIDAGGAEIEPVARRLDHPELPVIAGEGADAAAAEALAILAEAAPVAPRIRGLVRVGDRRWDLLLDRDLVVMLPMRDPVDALAHALALHAATGLVDRDLAAIDLRLPERPTFRMTARGAERLRRTRAGEIPGEDA